MRSRRIAHPAGVGILRAPPPKRDSVSRPNATERSPLGGCTRDPQKLRCFAEVARNICHRSHGIFLWRRGRPAQAGHFEAKVPAMQRVGSTGRELRYTARTLCKERRVVAVANFAVALAIGATTVIFRVMADAASLHRHEFGVRMAWGAQPEDISRLALREVLARMRWDCLRAPLARDPWRAKSGSFYQPIRGRPAWLGWRFWWWEWQPAWRRRVPSCAGNRGAEQQLRRARQKQSG